MVQLKKYSPNQKIARVQNDNCVNELWAGRERVVGIAIIVRLKIKAEHNSGYAYKVSRQLLLFLND